MNIQQEFSCNYPQLVYVDHKYLENSQIGVSFVHVYDGRVFGGVKIFDIKDGNIQWGKVIKTYQSWADIKQRTR